MSENQQQEQEVQAGAEAPVSGVVHLFGTEETQGGPHVSLCGSVGSYGPFQPREDAEAEVCQNCQRVADQRETEAADAE